jgi:hypothetical protein
MRRWVSIFGCSVTCFIFATPGDLDIKFKPDLPQDFAVTLILEQSDGRLLIAGNSSAVGSDGFYTYYLLRLRANGRTDPTFQLLRRRAELVIGPALDITERADGTIGAIGPFVPRTRGSSAQSAVVFQRNGRLTAYSPATNFTLGTWMPDGGIAFDATPHRDFYEGLAPWEQLGQLSRSGDDVLVRQLPYRGDPFRWLKSLPDGNVLAIFAARPAGAGSTYHLLYSSRWGGLRFEWNYGFPIPSVIQGPSNTIYVASSYTGPGTGIVRYGPGWQQDERFVYAYPAGGASPLAVKYTCMASQTNGKLIYSVCAELGSTNYLFRCDETGQNDTTFHVAPVSAAVHGLLTLRNRQVLVWGDFTEFNGTPAQKLVRLNTD